MGSEAFRDRVSVWQRDTDGRVLSLLINIVDIYINLVNVYAPRRPAERRVFLQSLHTYFFPNSRFIVGGDFNCYDSHLDKLGSAVIDSNLLDFKSAKLSPATSFLVFFQITILLPLILFYLT